MARYLEGANYRNQSDKFKGKYTKNQFRGIQEMKGKRAAGDKLMGRKGVDKMEDLSKGERRRFSENNPVSFTGDARDKGKQYYDDGKLTKITDESNPFAVKNIDKFATDSYGRGAQRGKEIISTQDLRGLKNLGEFDKADIISYADRQREAGTTIGGKAEAILDKWKTAIMEAEKNPNPAPPGTEIGISDIDEQGNSGTKGAIDVSDSGSVAAGEDSSTFVADLAKDFNVEDSPITIGGNAYGDVGNVIDKSRNYVNNMGGGTGEGYESALGLSDQYIQDMEDNYAEYSGPNYGIKVSNMFMDNARNSVNSAGLMDEAQRNPSRFFDIGNQFQAGIFGSGRNIAYDGEWMMPGEPEDLSLEEQIERLKSSTLS